MKLRTKFFLIYTLISILPLLALSAFSINWYRTTTEERISSISDTMFENAVKEADATLSEMTNTINFISFYGSESYQTVTDTLKIFDENSKYTSYDIMVANTYFTAVFQNLMMSSENINGIYLFSPSGETFGTSKNQYSKINNAYRVLEHNWYQETIQSDSEITVSTQTDSEMFDDSYSSIYFTKVIMDIYTHNPLGILVLDCDPACLDLSNVNSMDEDALLTITNTATGETLYTNLDSDTLPEKDTFGYRHEQSLDFNDLVLAASFNQSTMAAPYQPLLRMMLIVILVAMLADILINYYVTQKLTHPIEVLSGIMSRQENYAVSDEMAVYTGRSDEIGTLYNEYSSMLQQLEASVKKNYQDKLILLDAQMKSLEARINSHFLFNTLESINSMAELDDNEQIATMSLALGEMFRYSIKTESELVPLSSELHHVDDYNQIQQIRFNRKYNLVTDIPDDLREVRVLKLILQPIVENALYHGLAYCTAGDQIRITASAAENTLTIDVSDNGQGMSEEVLHEITDKLQEEASFTELGHRTKQSIGLKNIHSRIELYYGKGYGLQVMSQPGEGTTVRIRLPIVN